MALRDPHTFHANIFAVCLCSIQVLAPPQPFGMLLTTSNMSDVVVFPYSFPRGFTGRKGSTSGSVFGGERAQVEEVS